MAKSDAPLFSIIVAYNKPAVLEHWLLPSLRLQSATHELMPIQNDAGQFTSAAAALNHGAENARGEFLLFVHQDVQLPLDDPDWLNRAALLMRTLADLGVAGIIGMTGDGRTSIGKAFNCITQGVPPHTWRIENRAIDRPVPVQTLDEMMLIVPRTIFAQLPFDEKTCDGWHLYGVDYALSVAGLGYCAYVLPLTLHHVSPGTVDADYFITLKKVLAKHRSAARWLYTGCGVWNTRVPVLIQKVQHKLQSAMRMAKLNMRLWNSETLPGSASK